MSTLFHNPATSLLFIVVIFSVIQLKSQSEDSLQPVHTEFITDQLELLSQQTDQRIDFTDLVEDYLYYAKNPINLNGENIEKLVELYFINGIQLNNIRSYIYRYGQMLSVFELKNVPGIDQQTLQNILPFVTVREKQEQEKITSRKLFKYSRHSLIFRYMQVVEPSVGYRIPSDSALLNPGKKCLGSPQAYYLRYGFKYKDKLRFGFTLEKDAGEMMFSKTLNDSLQVLVGKKIGPVVDFFSGFVFLSNLGILKKAVIGDYHLEFGQGLTLWTGMSFGKSVSGTQLRKFGQGIRPNTSANENLFMRGGAFTLEWKFLRFTGFYSKNSIDAKILTSTSGDDRWVRSMQETGKHRTINELLGKDALNISAFGGRVVFQHRKLHFGATAYRTVLGAEMLQGDALYQMNNFKGRELVIYGMDFSTAFNKLSLFGEISKSQAGGFAVLAGLNAYLSDRLSLTLLFRHFARDYHNLFNNPISETGNPANELGLYLGFKILVAKNLNLSGYLDHFQFSWLRYMVEGPSQGRDYQLQLNYSPSVTSNMYLRFRYRKKEENGIGTSFYTNPMSTFERVEFRYFISYSLTKAIIFKNRIDYVLFQKEGTAKNHGYLIYQDILYRPEYFPLEATFRYALFSTEGFDSRIYSYENDVLYAFSVPAYTGNGHRIYLMLRYKAGRKLSFWIRVARTVFTNRLSIGSGCDEIEGRSKTEVKVQILIKL